MDSILTSIKKLLGLGEEYVVYDNDLIIHINAVFAILRQLGVGPGEGFKITSDSETWNDFLGESTLYEEVKAYMYLKVRLIFDPPINGSVTEAYKEQIKEYECRMNYTADAIREDQE